MAKLSKAERSAAARKGAKTKAYQVALATAINYKNMLDNGTSVHEIALNTNQTVRDVLDALKILTLAPHPALKAIGIAANLAGVGSDIANRFNSMPVKHKDVAVQLTPLINKVLAHPESVRPAIINTLNSFGKALSQPFVDANTFLNELISGQRMTSS